MFRFSLRSMMIGVTLVCILLGGRIEYLRQMAMFHRRKYRILGEIAVRTPTGPYDPGIEPMVAMMNYHLQMEVVAERLCISWSHLAGSNASASSHFRDFPPHEFSHEVSQAGVRKALRPWSLTTLPIALALDTPKP